VGQFKLTSKVVPQKAAVGEPVTWTLELSGTGNWPEINGLPAREVSNDFQVVQPKAKRTPAEGKLFDVTLSEDVVLVPSKSGTYALGPVNFTYFDPKSGTYKTINAPRSSVTITAPAAPQFNIGGATAATEPPPPQPEKLAKPPAAPSPPAGIPRDPLPGADEVLAPLSTQTLVLALSLPPVALVLAWLWLAVQRAKLTDPVRPRREARDRLLATLRNLQSASEHQHAPLLLAWQHETAALWQLRHAAPGATAMPDARWAQLWTEADRALYGARTGLPGDWVARAQEAAAGTRLPGFKPARLFLPQNLMPFAAALAIGVLSTAAYLHAAELDALAAYRKGDFNSAEKSWRSRIDRTPTDWIARHNLSLALAQQERTGEAAGHAAAAFVQKPDDPSVRWHFALAAERAGAAPAVLTAFIAPGPLQSLGRMMSVGNWHLLLIVSAWGIALGLGWLLVNAYRARGGHQRWAAVGVAAVFLGLAGSAVAGATSYGLAADADAVLVARSTVLRSIPTEADTTQKTTPLAIGSIARADKAFLGWRRIAFENGQTGWVRKEDIVALWK
jgi:hypothetical protein